MFLDPAAAAHGDLGMIGKGDVLVVLSNSGKTREVIEMITGARGLWGKDVTLISVSGDNNSPIYNTGEIALWYGKVREPCPLGLTPTASIAAVGALLDALAMCVLK